MSVAPFSSFISVAEIRSAFLSRSSQGKQSDESVFAFALSLPCGLAPALLDCRFEFAGQAVAETLFFRECLAEKTDTFSVVGLGNVSRLRFEQEHPFSDAALEIQAVNFVADVALLPFLRHYGGGAFDPRRVKDEQGWVDFGSASFILPRLNYLEFDSSAALVVIFRSPEFEHSMALVEAVIAHCGSLQSVTQVEPLDALNDLDVASPSPKVLSRSDSADETVWTELLGRAQARMESGTLAKVVAARRVTVELSQVPALSQLVQRLRSAATDCTVFALRLGEQTFVGATPETLVRKCGPHISTEALAGTRALGTNANVGQISTELLTSKKDRYEHQFVVTALKETLAPFCQDLAVPLEPGVRILRRMVHLRTPITAQVDPAMHVLTLVGALHPTPAVGGVPRQNALDFICFEEGVERGWYAAPFGWCSSEGDGHFVVALRSALLSGTKAHLYAGAGIVPESDAALEYQETELKMTSMLNALGLAS